MSWFNKLKKSFTGAADKITQIVNNLVNCKKIDQQTLKDLEKTLLQADLGTALTAKIIAEIKKLSFDKNLEEKQVYSQISELIAGSFDPNLPKTLSLAPGLSVMLICGVNGNGKTTTIGKLANLYISQNKKVVMAACDTFRAAANEQLHHWANVTGSTFIKGDITGADPASVAYKAVKYAMDNNADVLLIDTAGRLNNNANLMQELAKIRKVVNKLDSTFPQHCLLVLDATTGQSALNQVRDFKALIPELDGLIITKMDSGAKAGIALNIVEQFNLPIYFIGTGEKISDLEPFDPKNFTHRLLS